MSFPSDGFPGGAIVVEGARQNNLRGVTVRIPRRALTAVTGVSGSGKSSLAVDTLYAEGQRRFLEGVAPHARRFLERLPRPDVDRLEGLTPAICLEQRTSGKSVRSTVGTATEVHDLFRLLFARAGTVHCLRCGGEAPRWSLDAVVAAALSEERRLLVGFAVTVVEGREVAEAALLRAGGYLRVVAGGETRELDAGAPGAGRWIVVQDRVAPGRRERLVEAFEAAFRAGDGRAFAVRPDGSELEFRLGRHCGTCGVAADEPEPAHFSFNHPIGACPECGGFGAVLTFDPDKTVPDPGLTLDEGALRPFAGRWRSWFLRRLLAGARGRAVPRDVPWRDLGEEDRKLLLYGGEGFIGVEPFLARLARKSYKAGARFLVKRYQSRTRCPACGGDRLGPRGRAVRIGGATLAEWSRRPVDSIREALSHVALAQSARAAAARVLAELDHRLEVLERVGVGYLTLERPVRTLSGGEAQRIELAQALGARLVDTLYVLDEPTVGLHPRDTERLLHVLRDLVHAGNTVVVVEHDPDVIERADWIVELGPGPGPRGGTVVYEGPSRPTAAASGGDGPAPRPKRRGSAPRLLTLSGAVLHNLKRVEIALPAGRVVGICGVSGSGKSTLVADTLVPLVEEALASGRRAIERPGLGALHLDAAVHGLTSVDQAPLARSSRSIPASYVGAWSGVRALYASLPEARRRGLAPGAFSFNVSGGRCEACRGEGETVVDMDFMPDVRIPCERCRGRRFEPAIEGVRFRGRSVADVLELGVDQAAALFAEHPAIARPLWWLGRVGLGYLLLGQSASTLSGGESQRLKLARELAHGRRGRLFVLDEPTVGLHPSEVRGLAGILADLADGGNSVVVVEHNLDLLLACDHLIEVGPEGGDAGGEIVAVGTPAEVAAIDRSPTGTHLRRRLDALAGEDRR